jgi:Zn finger protein HypA/HybF involved in hydrogenase expression
MTPTPLYKTLEQELSALLRGVSYECLACGEFVLRGGRTVSCPECGSHLRDVGDVTGAGLQFESQAG